MRGRIITEGGKLEGETQVSLYLRGPYPVNPYVKLKEDMTFEIAHVQDGEYDLHLWTHAGGRDLPRYYVREIRSGDRVIEDRIRMESTQASEELHVLLDFRGGTVAGRVLDEEKPAAARVVLMSADASKRTMSRYSHFETTDSNGHFLFRGVAPGEYVLFAWPADDSSPALDPELYREIEKHSQRVEVKRSGHVVQNLKLTAELRALALQASQD